MPASLAANCVLWYRCDSDPAGLTPWTLTDSSGAGNHGTKISPTVPAFVANTLSFDGLTNQVTFSSNAISRVNVTVAAWIKVTAYVATSQRIIDNSQTCVWGPVTSSSSNVFYSANTGANPIYSASGSLPTGIWTHVAVTKASVGVGQIYINGVLSTDGAGTNLTVTSSADQNAILGGRSSDYARQLNGSLDDIMTFNRVLTPTEVLALYIGTSTPTPARP
jgi:hypothetical protein